MRKTRSRALLALAVFALILTRLLFSNGYEDSLAQVTLTLVKAMNRVATKTERGPERERNLVMTRRRSYQKGSVELHNGQWTVRYREFDHASRRWIIKREVLGKFKNKKEARRAGEPVMVGVNERNNSNKLPEKPSDINSEMTFSQFVKNRWKKYTVSAKHQPSTLDCHGSLIKHHLLPHFGDRQLQSITPSDISDVLEESGLELSANTLQSIYGLLRLMFDIACEYDLIERSPVRPKLHRPEIVKVEKPTLRAAEIRAILAKMHNAQERLFTLLGSFPQLPNCLSCVKSNRTFRRKMILSFAKRMENHSIR